MPRIVRAGYLVLRSFAVIVLLIAAHSTTARADWPSRAITIVVPFSRGGHTDMVARFLAAQFAERLGQTVNVQNRVGENGTFDLTAGSSAANGYTLMVTSNAVLINAALSRDTRDPLKDFAPVAYLGAAPNVIVVLPSTGIATIGDLVAKAKANPGKLTYASAGVGTSSALTVELLKILAGIDINHVPFNGSGPALMAALSGACDFASLSTLGLMPHIRSGELRALLQTGSERWAELPDVPTLIEVTRLPKAVAETSVMLLAPWGTPPDIIEALAQKTRDAVQQQDIQAKMLATGFIVKYEGPDALRARITREMAQWRDIVSRLGMRKK